MTTWIIEPHDPLIVRDGRPFGPSPGARARSLSFPVPSTMTGAVRTRWGSNADGKFVRTVKEARMVAVRGPWLVEVDRADRIKTWLAPAPADALLLAQTQPALPPVRKVLVPLELPESTATNLPAGLWPVGLTRADPRKPLSRPPTFWYWQVYEQWLADPGEGTVRIADVGHRGPLREQRMHVGIQPGMLTAIEGALFQTQGLEFTRVAVDPAADPYDDRPALRLTTRLALAVDTGVDLTAGPSVLGGERRIVTWRGTDQTPPACPPAIRDRIISDGACRLVLLTPGIFAKGIEPEWILTADPAVSVTLKAMAVPRAQVVSGWDYDRRGPKETRRLVPAGTVMYVKLEGDKADIAAWVDARWMQPLSDGDQNRLDGFGMAVLGTWSGKPDRMEE